MGMRRTRRLREYDDGRARTWSLGVTLDTELIINCTSILKLIRITKMSVKRRKMSNDWQNVERLAKRRLGNYQIVGIIDRRFAFRGFYNES